MQNLKSYIQNFMAHAGSYVLFATIAARLLSFLASWAALQLIDNKELGIVLFAFNIVSFFIPMGGFGLHQSLIRYGALAKTDEEKNNLFVYTLKFGFLASLLLTILLIVSSFFIEFSFEKTRSYFILLSFIIVPHYIFELIKIQLRLKHQNKSFAFAELLYSIILITAVISLSYLYKETGYAIALLITPLLSAFILFLRLKIDYKNYLEPIIATSAFYKYGFFASLSNVLTQLLVVIDIFLIGYLLQDASMVTAYKYISLIPFSLLFLPMAFITTDFVAFTENIYDKEHTKNYIKGYLSFFSIIGFALLVFLVPLSKYIVLIFGREFVPYADTFTILTLGVCGILIFRGLFGNLLSSIGKAHVNYYISGIALLLNLVSNYVLIPLYGIKGAAITSAILMWLTGILSYTFFNYYYKKLE